MCVGDIQTTWTFSAFTVLGYYAITNLAALKLAEADRLFPKWISLTGFLSCLVLALVLAIYTSLPGVGLIVAGLIWFAVAAKLKKA